MITNSLKDNSKDHESPDTNNKAEKPTIIVRTNTICHPRTVMVVNTYASVTYLAMS